MSHQCLSQLKKKLRHEVRAKRQLLSKSYRNSASLQIIENFKKIPLNQHPNIVTGFFPQDGELNIEPLMDFLGQRGCQVAVPVIDFANKKMQFQLRSSQTSFTVNSYGIKEPEWNSASQIVPSSIDLVLYPLVAFDDKCHRLGMGGGYYDKYFSFLSTNPSDDDDYIASTNRKALVQRGHTSPILVGCGFDCQQIDAVPVEPWDIGLDYVITESRVY